MSTADEIQKYKELLDQGAITQEEFNKKKEELLNGSSRSSSGMNAQTTSILAYITWIGFIIAVCAGDKEGAKFHINQALVINLFAFLGFIPFLGWIWEIFVFVCWIMGLVYAIDQNEKEVPLIGKIHILK